MSLKHPEIPQEWINSIIQEDCIKGMKKLPESSIDLIVTSPPYNIGIDYGGYDDNKDFEKYQDFLEDSFMEMFRVIKEKGLVAINVGNQRNSGLPHYIFNILKKCGFHIIKEIFWYKGLYYIQGETIFVCSKSGEYNKCYGKDDGFYASGQFSTVWEMRYKDGQSKSKLGHNAFFVKQLPINFIKINTKEGDMVLDPFMGSGTVALACKELNRNYLGFEISSEYIKISQKRLSQENLFKHFNNPNVVSVDTNQNKILMEKH